MFYVKQDLTMDITNNVKRWEKRVALAKAIYEKYYEEARVAECRWMFTRSCFYSQRISNPRSEEEFTATKKLYEQYDEAAYRAMERCSWKRNAWRRAEIELKRWQTEASNDVGGNTLNF